MGPTHNFRQVERGIRRYFVIESILIVIASVMVFGLLECWANFIVLNHRAYDPVYMVYMAGPMAIVMSIVAFFNMRSIKRYSSRSAHARNKNAKSPKNWLAIETAAITAVAVLSFCLIEYIAERTVGASRAYHTIFIFVMAGAMGLTMGLIAHSGLKSAKLRIVRAMADLTRTSSDGLPSPRIEATRGVDKTQIASRLNRWRVLESMGIVIASVMTYGVVDFEANFVLGNTGHYHPINMIGMILPMGLVVGSISYITLKFANRFLAQLLGGIERVAHGKLDTRLSEKRAGPFHEVFANFNDMCGELQSVQTLRDDFINHFSHEFKTPITSISGFAKLLLEEDLSAEERKQYLTIIAEESERLEEMSTGALMITKLESQQHLVDKAPYALDEQIKQCAILLSPQWTKKRLDVSADLNPATYLGNADLMRQVWINLIGNAIKFTPEGGSIAIGLRRERGFLVATVSDTGKGMTKEELARACEKYYQGDSSQASRGLGLGLSIAQRIVELCDGRLEAHSVLGEGSTFTVRLPIAMP